MFGLAHPKPTKITCAYMGYQAEKLVGEHKGRLWGSMSFHATLNFFVVSGTIVREGLKQLAYSAAESLAP